MSTRDEYIRKMHVKLDELNAEIDVLAGKAGELAADALQGYHEQMESLKEKRVNVMQKLEELQHAGGSAWEDMKSGIDLAWTTLREAIDSARSRFR